MAPTRKPWRAYHSRACASVHRGAATASVAWPRSAVNRTIRNATRLNVILSPFAAQMSAPALLYSTPRSQPLGEGPVSDCARDAELLPADNTRSLANDDELICLDASNLFLGA